MEGFLRRVKAALHARFQASAGKVAENCAFLCYYAANSGNFFPTFQDNLSVLSSQFKNPEDGTIMLSRDINKKLPLLAA